MSKVDNVLRRVAFILEDASVSHESMEMEAADLLPQLAEMVRVAREGLEISNRVLQAYPWPITTANEVGIKAVANALTAMEKVASDGRALKEGE